MKRVVYLNIQIIRKGKSKILFTPKLRQVPADKEGFLILFTDKDNLIPHLLLSKTLSRDKILDLGNLILSLMAVYYG